MTLIYTDKMIKILSEDEEAIDKWDEWDDADEGHKEEDEGETR